MQTSRWLGFIGLLLGSCDLLWGPFYIKNPSCRPDSGLCTNSGSLADGGDGGAGSSDAGAPADLTCMPGTPATWVTFSPAPPTPVTDLHGIWGAIGTGGNEVWLFGTGYAALKDTADVWHSISISPPTLALGRAGGGRSGLFVAAANQLVQFDRPTLSVTKMVPIVSSPDVAAGTYDPNFLTLAFAGASNGKLFQFDLNQSTWIDQMSDAPFGLSFLSGGTAYAIWGASSTQVAIYSAATKMWSAAMPLPATINALWTADNADAWLVGPAGTILQAHVPASGQIMFTMSSSPTSANLHDVTGLPDGSQVWAVGDGGVIVHWDASCQKWTQEISGTSQNLYAVSAGQYASSKIAWAAGANGVLLSRPFP